jgi:hypothetical protein
VFPREEQLDAPLVEQAGGAQQHAEADRGLVVRSTYLDALCTTWPRRSPAGPRRVYSARNNPSIASMWSRAREHSMKLPTATSTNTTQIGTVLTPSRRDRTPKKSQAYEPMSSVATSTPRVRLMKDGKRYCGLVSDWFRGGTRGPGQWISPYRRPQARWSGAERVRYSPSGSVREEELPCGALIRVV